MEKVECNTCGCQVDTDEAIEFESVDSWPEYYICHGCWAKLEERLAAGGE